MSDFGDVKDLELKRAELDEAIKNFNTAHQAYHGQFEDQTEIDDSQEYYDATLLLANDSNYKRIIDDWHKLALTNRKEQTANRTFNPRTPLATMALELFQSLRPDLRPVRDPREVVQCLVLE